MPNTAAAGKLEVDVASLGHTIDEALAAWPRRRASCMRVTRALAAARVDPCVTTMPGIAHFGPSGGITRGRRRLMV
jgi:hypothetical protein